MKKSFILAALLAGICCFTFTGCIKNDKTEPTENKIIAPRGDEMHPVEEPDGRVQHMPDYNPRHKIGNPVKSLQG